MVRKSGKSNVLWTCAYSQFHPSPHYSQINKTQLFLNGSVQMKLQSIQMNYRNKKKLNLIKDFRTGLKWACTTLGASIWFLAKLVLLSLNEKFIHN